MKVIALTLLCLVFGQTLAQNHPWDPQIQDASWLPKEVWLKRHQQLLDVTKQHASEEKIVFLGDSITEAWAYDGINVWNQHYGTRHAFNYGIGGDRTEHVIWRLANEEFDNVKANAVVLMIGTNNLGQNTVEDIAHGVQEVLNRLSQKMPNAKVLLLGVLPRGDAGLGPKAKQLNTLLVKLADNNRVHWLDMWDQFANSNGQVKSELFKPDTLHLVEKGYQVWQKSMESLLNKLSPN